MITERTRELLRLILTSDKAWDTKTRQMRLHWVLEELSKAKERLWYDTVLFPRMDRAVRLIRLFNLLPEDHFTMLEITEGQEINWIDCDDCYEKITERLESQYFERLWYTDEWAYEDVTQADIEAINIRPNLVPAKKNQPSLF